MATTLLTETTKQMLGTAMKLEKSGAKTAARAICIKCAKNMAMTDDGEDVILLFYGESAYDYIKDAKAAMEYILVAECAKLLYGEMKGRGSANGMQIGKQAWINGNSRTSDDVVSGFFSWLCGKRKDGVSEKDKDRFVNTAIAIKVGTAMKTDEAVSAMSPIEVLRSAAVGKLRVLDDTLCSGGYGF